MKLKTVMLTGGMKSEYSISLQYAEPKYGKVTVTHPSKSKPNLVVNISSNVIEEGYTTYSIGAITVTTTKGQPIQVNSVSSNNWSFVMPASDVVITASEIKQTRPCLDADTLITLVDDRQIKFRDLTEEDMVKVWDFDNGKYGAAKLLWLPPVCTAKNYYQVVLENSVVINVINNHRAFCCETCQFERMLQSIGKHVWHVDGAQRIVDIRFVDKSIEYRNAISFHHMNIITNGVLTSTGFNNLYPVDNMMYVKVDRPKRSEDDFGLDQRWYKGLRLYEHYTSSSEARQCINISWGSDQWLIK